MTPTRQPGRPRRSAGAKVISVSVQRGLVARPGLGDLSEAALLRIYREVCCLTVAPGELAFPPDAIRVSAIRLEDRYGGRGVTLRGVLGLGPGGRRSGPKWTWPVPSPGDTPSREGRDAAGGG